MKSLIYKFSLNKASVDGRGRQVDDRQIDGDGDEMEKDIDMWEIQYRRYTVSKKRY